MNPALILTWTVGICAALTSASAAGQLDVLIGHTHTLQVTAAAGLLGLILSVPLGYFVSKNQQASFVAKQIEDPQVKVTTAQALTSLPGVVGLDVDKKTASPELLDLAKSTDPANTKINAV